MYGGEREVIPDVEQYFNFTQEQIDEAVRDITNTTSSFERYLVNSIGTYNGKEAFKTRFDYCNKGLNSECLQRGARMQKAFRKFADMPPQAYFQFGLTSILNQGVNASKDTARSMFRRGGTRKAKRCPKCKKVPCCCRICPKCKKVPCCCRICPKCKKVPCCCSKP